MLGGRSLVNNSIFNLVLMLAGVSLTSSPSFLFFFFFFGLRTLLLHFVFVLSHRRFLSSFLRVLSPLLLSFIFPLSFVATYPGPCRRPDKSEISTTSANINFYIAIQVRRVLSTPRVSRNQKRRNSTEEKERIRGLFSRFLNGRFYRRVETRVHAYESPGCSR